MLKMYRWRLENSPADIHEAFTLERSRFEESSNAPSSEKNYSPVQASTCVSM